MKRLIKTKKYLFKTSKLLKCAEWKDINVNSNDIVNILTDAMSQNSVVKVNYQNSGWRNILPYGWYTSKDNNVILYCYKDNLAIRSYRLDKIMNLMIDDELDTDVNKQDEDNINPNDFEILNLPENNDEILEISETEQGTEGPFDDSLDLLNNNWGEDSNEVNEMLNSDVQSDLSNDDIYNNNINEESEQNEQIL